VAKAAKRCFKSQPYPIPDRGVPQSFRGTISLLRSLSALLDEGKNVAVHCRQGIGRSGMIAASLLIGSGTSAQKALETVSAARGQTVPETAEQVEWIRQLPSEPLAVTT